MNSFEVEIFIKISDLRILKMAMECHGRQKTYYFTGLYPVVYLEIIGLVNKWLNLEKLMCSVAWLNAHQKHIDIHVLLNFDGYVFADCGIFQRKKYDQQFAPTKLHEMRENLIECYRHLRPDLASSLDLPSLMNYRMGRRIRRIKISVENYKTMKEKLGDSIKLVLGVSIFTSKEANILSKYLEKKRIEPEILGLGGQVPLLRSGNIENLRRILRNIFYLKSKFPKVPIHVYGTGDHRFYGLMRLLGASSSDYASYTTAAGRGMIIVRGLGPRYLSKTITIIRGDRTIYYKRPPHLLLNKKQVRYLQNCQCPVCKRFNLDTIERDRNLRMIHNLSTIISESRSIDSYIEAEDHKSLLQYLKNDLLARDKNGDFEELTSYASRLLSRIG